MTVAAFNQAKSGSSILSPLFNSTTFSLGVLDEAQQLNAYIIATTARSLETTICFFDEAQVTEHSASIEFRKHKAELLEHHAKQSGQCYP